MNTLRHVRTFFVFAVAALAVTALPLQAAPATDGPVADVLLGTTQVQWTPMADFAGLRLTVSGPNGTDQYDFGPGEAPLFDLASVVVTDIDGQYSWELRATPKVDASQISAAARTPGFAGGERQRPAGLPAEHDLVQSGTFRVVDGAIVQPAIEGAPELMVDGAGLDHVTGGLGSVTAAAQTIATDLIVQGSACVGVDCVSSESFGFDTLRLKENNLRIDFTDTSNSGSFPTVDWTIVANDSANGGASYLAFQDDNAGRVPFRVDAGAPTNALRVEGSGDIGMGTDNPVVELHIVDGDTPTLRLQQDGSAGFTQQTWDIAGNEANFFVRDVTNGSRLSFRIEPGAPESSIYIDSTGNVGIGTASPSFPVSIVRSGASVQDLLNLEASNATAQTVRLRLSNAANTWFNGVTSSGNLTFNAASNSGTEAFITPTGDMTITGTLTTGGGTCGSGCDLVFSPDYELPSIDEHAQEMWANSHLPAVGPTQEGAPFNITEKVGGMLNELEKAHIYIEQLHARLSDKEQTVSTLEAQIDALTTAVEELRQQR